MTIVEDRLALLETLTLAGYVRLKHLPGALQTSALLLLDRMIAVTEAP